MLPPIELRDQLLRVYMQFVYPYLPVIDLSAFLESIDRAGVGETISLSLLQAIFFTASAFVNMDLLSQAGFQTRSEARRTFFGRVRVLYIFSFETDRISLIQILLHMTHWTEELNTIRDPGVWLATAITIARSVGLHSHFRYASFSSKQKSLAKRIWWTCFTRDRVLALLLRRPPMIEVEDFTTPFPELLHFKLQTSSTNLQRTVHGCPNVGDAPDMEIVAKLYISLIRLCLCMTTTLKVRHFLCKPSSTSCHSLHGYAPREALDKFGRVLHAEQELEQWNSGLPNQVKYASEDAQHLNQCEYNPVIKLHRAFLHGIYLASKIALHRDATLVSASESAIPDEFKEWSRQKARDAATNIISMFRDLLNSRLIRCLPSVSVNLLLEAVTASLSRTSSTDSSSTQNSIRVLYNCLPGLESLSDVYESAETARKVVAAAKRRLEASLVKLNLEHKNVSTNQPEKHYRIETLSLAVLTPSSELEETASPTAILVPHSHNIEQTSPSGMESTTETAFGSRTTFMQTHISQWTPRDGSIEGDLVHDHDSANAWDHEFENLVHVDMFATGEFQCTTPMGGIFKDHGC